MHKDDSKFLIKGSLWQTFSQISLKLVSLVYLLILTRLVSQGIIGDFYFVLSIIGMFTIFSDFGLSNTVVRYIPYFYGKKMFSEIKNLIKITLFIGGLFSIFLILVIYYQASNISSFFNNSGIFALLQIMSPFILLTFLFNLLLSLLISRGAVRENVLASNIQNISKLFLTFLFFYFFGISVVTIAAAFLLSYILAINYASFSFLKLWKLIPKSDATTMKATELLREIIPFGITVSVIVMFSSVVGYTDRIMLGYFLDPSVASETIAVYTVVLPLAALVSLFSGSITAVFLPKISELIGKGVKNFNQITKLTDFSVKWSIISMVPFLAYVFSFSKDILLVIYGEAYQSGYLVFGIFSLGMFLLYLSHVQRLVLAGMRLVRLELKMVAVSAILNVILNLLLIPKFGAEGAAVSTAASFLAITIITQHYSKQAFGFSLSKDVYKTIFAGFIPLISLFLVHNYVSFAISKPTNPGILDSIIFKIAELAILSIPFLIGTIIYLLVLMLLRVFDKNDFEIFKAALVHLKVPSRITDNLDKYVLLKKEQDIY